MIDQPTLTKNPYALIVLWFFVTKLSAKFAQFRTRECHGTHAMKKKIC